MKTICRAESRSGTIFIASQAAMSSYARSSARLAIATKATPMTQRRFSRSVSTRCNPELKAGNPASMRVSARSTPPCSGAGRQVMQQNCAR
jgi:hypothetical protein